MMESIAFINLALKTSLSHIRHLSQNKEFSSILKNEILHMYSKQLSLKYAITFRFLN